MITRIAPSPTGPMHIWTARSALYNWLLARQSNGKFLVRIEDTDKERSKDEYLDIILKWFERLGLTYDWELYFQSKNEELYNKHIDQLLVEWKAYDAYESAEEIDMMRKKAESEKKPFVFRQINYTDEQLKTFEHEWRKPVIRFKVTPKELTQKDLVKWDIKINMWLIWDFVIRKSNGSPLFYIANVIDDHIMGIDNVIRWEDHLSNTSKQILLYEAFGWEVPSFWHLPLLLNMDASKMSKRDTSDSIVTISKFKEAGFLKEALLNYIILLGWHTSDDREIFTLEEMTKEFSISRVNSSNAKYDYQRALWFNWEYIRQLSDNDFMDRITAYLNTYGDDEWQSILQSWNFKDQKYTNKWIPEIKVRLQTLGQFKDYAKYLFQPQNPTDEILYNSKMKVTKEMLAPILPALIETLKNIDQWEPENLKEQLITFIKQKWLKNWQVLRPIRAILTWVQASPWAFEMMGILGKEESVKRIMSYEL